MPKKGQFWKKHKMTDSGSDVFSVRLANAIGESRHIEALVLQMSRFEIILRGAINELGGNKASLHKFVEADVLIPTLIDYFELLGGERSLAEKMIGYNKGRNLVIHNPRSFETMEKLDQKAKEVVTAGKQVIRELSILATDLGYARMVTAGEIPPPPPHVKI